MYRSPSRYSLSLWHTPQRMCRFSHPSLPPTERATMCARSLPSIPQAKQVPRSKNSASESNPLMAQSLFAQCALIANSDGILRGVVFMAFSVIQLNRAVEWTSHSPLRYAACSTAVRRRLGHIRSSQRGILGTQSSQSHHLRFRFPRSTACIPTLPLRRKTGTASVWRQRCLSYSFSVVVAGITRQSTRTRR